MDILFSLSSVTHRRKNYSPSATTAMFTGSVTKFTKSFQTKPF